MDDWIAHSAVDAVGYDHHPRHDLLAVSEAAEVGYAARKEPRVAAVDQDGIATSDKCGELRGYFEVITPRLVTAVM